MERRKTSVSKSSLLPADYLKMVEEVFAAHFDDGLKIYQKFKPGARFEASGSVFSDEVLLIVALVNDKDISATTVNASSDFDPRASAPTVQDVLSVCVDAAGAVFGSLLSPEDPKRIEDIAEESLSSLENVPLVWTAIEADQKKIFVKVDRSNPKLDRIADDWLAKNDPAEKDEADRSEKETEKLFVTGPKKKS